MKSLYRLATAVLLLSTLAAAANPQTSTPAERKRALDVIDKLERSPMDPALKADREWVFHWVKASDVDAVVCTAIIKPLTDQKASPERNALVLQNILASARFAIDQQGKKVDRLQMYQAGIEGTLRAYSNLTASDPTKKNEFMESLLAKQKQGELVAYVRKGAAQCAKHPVTVLEP
jgi:hypothetical protein